MRIGFDVRPFLKEETGVGIYLKNLLFSLSHIDQDNEYFLFSSSLKDRFNAQKIPPFMKMSFRDFHYPVKLMNFLWYKLGWPKLDHFFKEKLDITHSPTPLILPTHGKKIVTVYDLFFMDSPHQVDRETRNTFVRGIKSSLQKADGVITISEFTKKQLLEKFSLDPNKIKVIYLGIQKDYWEDISADELEKIKGKYNLPQSFLLFVGTIEPRKNILNLLNALKIIHEKHKKIPLVIVGRKGQDYENVLEKVRVLGLEDWVVFTGYIPEKELKGFYHLASLFVFPSLYEGFGLPLLEAMASGLPIVTSRKAALPEIAMDAALYFNPEEQEDIAEKILIGLKDETLRKQLIYKGKERVGDFNWRKTAEETLNFYLSIIEE